MTDDTILDEFEDREERDLSQRAQTRKRRSWKTPFATGRTNGQQSISRRLGGYKRKPITLASKVDQ